VTNFRPLILPKNVKIRIEKVKDGRSGSMVSLDGATRFLLNDGESVTVTGSDAYMGFVTHHGAKLKDLWVSRLTQMFGWNMRT
jgi:NAD kinase